MATLALTLSYDGRRFRGSQVQSASRTVQGVLAEGLAAIYREPVATVFAGRTDAGVHAAGQVVGLTEPAAERPPVVLRAELNWRLPDDVAVLEVGVARSAFHARFDAKWREYRYRIWSGERVPLADGLVWRRRAALDIGRMVQAGRILLGTHDFASFVGGGEGVPWSVRRGVGAGTVRTLFASELYEVEPWWQPRGFGGGRLIEYRVIGDGFLPRMVRSLVSALVDVGRGEREPGWMAELLGGRDRRLGPGTAPAHGLTLWQVGYDAYPRLGFLDETASQVAESQSPSGHEDGTGGSNHRGTAHVVTKGT